MPIPFFLTGPEVQLILFGGKGGVGKTTCASAAAIGIAGENPESNLLLLSTDPAHSLEDSLAGSSPPSNVRTIEFDMREHLMKFKTLHGEELEEIARRGTFLDLEDIRRFLDLSLPGMDELLSFLEICRWVDDEEGYDCIIVDTAPTGHTMRLLAMPGFLRKWVNALDVLLAKHRYMKDVFSGSYHPDRIDAFLEELSLSVERAEALLKDRTRCSFIVVMLAEELSIKETSDLIGELEDLGIPIGAVVVNRIVPESACGYCASARKQQMGRLGHLPGNISRHDLWGIPLYPEEVYGLEGLAKFWDGAWRLSAQEIRSIEKRVEREAPNEATLVPEVENPSPLPSPEMAFLLFAGKGGVGKTTMACATALRLAREFPEKRMLLFSTDPAHSLSDCLDLEIGPGAAHIMNGLSALEINAQAEFDALKEQYQDELARFLESVSQNLDFTFDREVMERILDLSPPGLDEIMALTRVMNFLGKKSYDLFILDSAPTGHLIRLLELPEIMDQWLKAFFEVFLKYKQVFKLPETSGRLVRMSKDLKVFRKMLREPHLSSLYAVSILTEMAFEETKDLVAACERMGISVPVLLLNMATPGSECRFCEAIEKREARAMEAFRNAFPAKHRTLIYRQGEPRGLKSLCELGNRIYRHV